MRRVAATAIACVALAAAGCGGANADGTDQASSQPAAVKPPADIAKAGKITYCTTSTNPPREYLENGKSAGSDVDLAEAMAKQMGVDVKWGQYKFDGLIAALQGDHCDMIVEELFIKPEREKVIKMLPFSVSAEQTVVRKGNPANISDLASLSGKKIGVPNGTTYQAILTDFNKKLKAKGEQPANIVTFPSTSDMYTQLQAGQIEAAGGTVSSAAYYAKRSGGELETAGKPFHPITDGFGIRKDDTALFNAMKKALNKVQANGTYAKIFKKYGLQAATLKGDK